MKNKYTTIKKELKKIKDGESLIYVIPTRGGYLVGIADKYIGENMDYCLAITQSELNELAKHFDKKRTDGTLKC